MNERMDICIQGAIFQLNEAINVCEEETVIEQIQNAIDILEYLYNG